MATNIEVRSFKCDLQNYKLLKEQLMKREQDLERVVYMMQGVGSINFEKIGRTESIDSSSKVLKFIKQKDFIENDISRIKERIKYVDEVLDMLEENNRRIILMIYVNGMTYFELGNQLGYSAIQLKRIVNRIIRKALNEREDL